MRSTDEVSTALPDLRAVPAGGDARRRAGPAESRPLASPGQAPLKVRSRCDLACDHCYVYQGADQRWRRQPMVMSDEVTTLFVERRGDPSASNRHRHHADGRSCYEQPLHFAWPLHPSAGQTQSAEREFPAADVRMARIPMRSARLGLSEHGPEGKAGGDPDGN